MVKVSCRAIEKRDLNLIQRWRNSDIVMPYCRQYRPLSMADMEKWYDSLTKDGDYNLTNDLFFIEQYEHGPIGVGGLVRIDWRNGKGELSLYVTDYRGDVESIVIETLLVLLDYAFKTLRLHKVYFPVYSFNPYLPFYEKVMKREYVAKGEYFWNGQYCDRIILSRFADEK